MFQELFNKVKEKLDTTRSVIHTNEKLREIVTTQNLLENQNELVNALKEITPDINNWRRYDHCSVVTRLYAIYESFVEDIVRDWVPYLPDIFRNYVDLPENVKKTHQRGTAQLLTELQSQKTRYKNLTVEKVIQGLFWGISGAETYELMPDAFLIHEQNLRKEALETLFTNAGITGSYNWIKTHNKIQCILGENTAEAELKKLIDYRNDAAHGSEISEILRAEELLNLCDFVEALCQALLELVTYNVICQKKR